MSESINICFEKAETFGEAAEKALVYCESLLEKNAVDEIFEANIYASPLNGRENDHGSINYLAHSAWVKQLFCHNFIWWRNLGIVGLVGRKYGSASLFSSNVYFQDSTDQSYEFKIWESTKCPEIIAIAQNWQSISSDKRRLKTALESSETFDWDIDDKFHENAEYYAATAAYKEIFHLLNLHEYMNGKRNSADQIIFSMAPTIDQYEASKLNFRFIHMLKQISKSI